MTKTQANEPGFVLAHSVIREIVDSAENIASDAGVGSSETAGVIVSFLAERPSLMPAFMAGTLSPVDTGMLDHHNGVLSWHGQDGGIHRPDASKARFPAPAPEALPARTAYDAIGAGAGVRAREEAVLQAIRSWGDGPCDSLEDLERRVLSCLSPVAVEEADAKAGAGLQAAIDFIEKRRDDFMREVGVYDHTTGAVDMSDAAHETVGEWDELIDAFQAMLAVIPSTPSPQIGKAGAGPVRNATDAMIEAGLKVDMTNEDEVAFLHNVWHAMVAAHPAGAGPVGEAVALHLHDETRPHPNARAICEALGFDPTNHHNAAKCPYCAPVEETGTPVPATAYKMLVHSRFALEEALTVIDPVKDHVTYGRIQAQAERLRAALTGDEKGKEKADPTKPCVGNPLARYWFASSRIWQRKYEQLIAERETGK